MAESPGEKGVPQLGKVQQNAETVSTAEATDNGQYVRNSVNYHVKSRVRK